MLIETWTVGKDTVGLEDAAALTDKGVFLAEDENAGAGFEEVAALPNKTLPVMLGVLMLRLIVAVVDRALGVPESVIWNVREVGCAAVAELAAESTPFVWKVTPVGSVPLVSFHV